MLRLQQKLIAKDLEEKIVLLAGPRQVGKTTLAKSLAQTWQKTQYLNYDSDNDRRVIVQQTWDRHAELVILDEVHKLKKWKTKIKGVFDVEGIPPRLLVTGSARMDVYRRGGDSLAGRHFLHRLYPLSVRELRGQGKPYEILDQLMKFGGFPEPFFAQSETAAARWRNQLFERVIRLDVQDLEPVKDIQTLLLLIDLLRERVGKPVSFASLARDLELSPHTVKRWIQTLANMYVVFVVSPYHRNMARALLKEPKIYFYDTGAVRGDEGAKLENAVAVCLLKHLHFLEDTQGKQVALHYIRDKEKREVDFVTMIEGKIEQLIEVKFAEEEPHAALQYYAEKLKPKKAFQLIHKLERASSRKNIHLQHAAEWLDQLEI